MFMIQNIDYFCSYIGRKVVAKSSLKSQTESSPCSIFIGFCHLDSVHRGKQEWNPTCKKRNHVICTEHSNYNKHLIRSNAFSNRSGGCMIVGIIWAFHFFVWHKDNPNKNRSHWYYIEIINHCLGITYIYF